MIYQQCNFCRETYCLQHALPEVHGCGQEARNHARAVSYALKQINIQRLTNFYEIWGNERNLH